MNFRGKEDCVGMLLNSLRKRKEADSAESSSPGPGRGAVPGIPGSGATLQRRPPQIRGLSELHKHAAGRYTTHAC